jgi:tRNA 2-thiouridine synthesizing protein A
MTQKIDTVLDTCGLFCPEPLMLLHQRIRSMGSGDVIEIIATDPSTTRDIPKFCQFLEHKLAYQAEAEGKYVFHIEKG